MSGWSSSAYSARRRELPADWQLIRQQVIARDRGLCVLCGQPGRDVDHVQRGDDHSLANLRLLCRSCHMKRTGRDGGSTPRRRFRRKKRWTRWDEDHPGIIRQ